MLLGSVVVGMVAGATSPITQASLMSQAPYLHVLTPDGLYRHQSCVTLTDAMGFVVHEATYKAACKTRVQRNRTLSLAVAWCVVSCRVVSLTQLRLRRHAWAKVA